MTDIQEVTAEEIARHYSAALDSCNLLNAGKPEDMTDEDWADTVKRNKEHLFIQLNKEGFYDGYDLQPFKDAVK
jgi:outer membrane receptor for ferric coprogen and ferric-rhodotorulic acid